MERKNISEIISTVDILDAFPSWLVLRLCQLSKPLRELCPVYLQYRAKWEFKDPLLVINSKQDYIEVLSFYDRFVAVSEPGYTQFGNAIFEADKLRNEKLLRHFMRRLSGNEQGVCDDKRLTLILAMAVVLGYDSTVEGILNKFPNILTWGLCDLYQALDRNPSTYAYLGCTEGDLDDSTLMELIFDTNSWYLFKYLADLDVFTMDAYTSAIVWAVSHYRLPIIKYIVDRYPNLVEQVLMEAAFFGDLELVKYAVENGATSFIGGIITASDYGHTDVIEFLERLQEAQ